MNIWTIRLRPHGDRPENEFGFCYQRGIIGIGWQVCRKPTCKKDYLKLVKAKYEKENAGKWKHNSETLACNMAEEDLVWCFNHRTDGEGDNRLYLGKILGDWEYRDGDEYRCADIVSIRPCQIHEVRAKDVHATKVSKNASKFFDTIRGKFPPVTVQKIANESLRQTTKKIWEEMQKHI